MADVYANTRLTVAATIAADDAEGCLSMWLE
jgi:hypothetical protein